MIQVQITRPGGPDVLRAIEAPPPPILPGHVRIKVSAAGVNFADVHMRMGLYAEAPRTPFVPGFEVAGVISEVGPGVSTFRRGERVMAACRFGGYTSEIVLPATPGEKDAAAPLRQGSRFDSHRLHHCLDRPFRDGACARRGPGPGPRGRRGRGHRPRPACRPRRCARGCRGRDVRTRRRRFAPWAPRRRSPTRSLSSRKKADARDFDIVLEARGGPFLKDALRRCAPAGRRGELRGFVPRFRGRSGPSPTPSCGCCRRRS